jgi:hypothetical protein
MALRVPVEKGQLSVGDDGRGGDPAEGQYDGAEDDRCALGGHREPFKTLGVVVVRLVEAGVRLWMPR